MNQKAQNETDLPKRPGADDYEAILDSLSAGICRLSPDGRILYVNESAAKMLGRDQSDVVGDFYPAVFFGDGANDGDPQCAPIQFTLDEHEVSHIGTEQLVRANGSELLAELIIVPVLKGGKAGGAVVSFVDATDRRDVEMAMSKARENALDAAKSKAEFLANMSHEIRTPLTGIIGTMDLLSRSELNSEQRECVRMLQTSAEFLNNLVNNILDFSKIEAGKFRPRFDDFTVSELTDSCLDSFRSVAAKKGISLSSEIAEGIPPRLCGDAQSIRQVLNNLLSNALKFTNEGSVVLKISPGQEDDKFRFSVMDTGIGIAEGSINELFAPFTQIESSDNRRFEGTGLGLSISKRLIELMRGEVGLESIEAQGTEVWFEIPLLPGKKAKESRFFETEVFGAADLAVLVVDDNPINLGVMTKMLGEIGISADIARDGREAVAACDRKQYDIVFMDCQMPGMDGYEAAGKIRKDATGRPSIIAFTASVQDGERGKFRQKGMDGMLRKPFTENDLINVINANSGRRKSNKNLDLGSDIREHSVSRVIDAPTLERLRNSDTDDSRGFLTEILEIFGEHTSARLIELTEFVSTMEREKIRRIAHNLKGSSANIGISRLAVYFEELEHRSKIGKKEDLYNLLHTIKNEFAAVDKVIRKLKKEETPNES